jgi:hypothetical protein
MWIVLFQLAILYICETVLIALKFPIGHTETAITSWTERVRDREPMIQSYSVCIPIIHIYCIYIQHTFSQ